MPTIYDGKLDRAARRCSEIMDILVDTLERAPEIHRPRVIDIAATTEDPTRVIGLILNWALLILGGVRLIG
ncbi:MAG: hypothetical protein WC583_04100 [Candidatus Omnitrophota bacterium]